MEAGLEQLIDATFTDEFSTWKTIREVTKAVIRSEATPALTGDRVRGLGQIYAEQERFNKIARYCDAMAGY